MRSDDSTGNTGSKLRRSSSYIVVIMRTTIDKEAFFTVFEPGLQGSKLVLELREKNDTD